MKDKEAIGKLKCLEFLYGMTLIRKFEESASEQYMQGNIKGFLHLYIGQEAVAVGAIAALEERDYIVTHYRDHGHALARGLDPKVIMAELFGKASGTSGGRGGSMHLFDVSKNFLGGYAIVGGQLPIATGIGLASSYRGEDSVTICFLGDGAINEGEFHEALNLASVWKLPVLFLVENNLYGMGAPVRDTLAAYDQIYKMAEAYRMPSQQVDGMDVLKTYQVSQDIISSIREGNGPYMLEALTYRYRGHSIADPAEYRTKAELEQWMAKDPINSLKQHILQEGIGDETDFVSVENRVDRLIEESVEFANQSDYPALETLYDHVYSD